jgi:hypothetical protein
VGFPQAVFVSRVSRRKTAIVRTQISLYNPRFPGVSVKFSSGIPQWFFVLVPKPSWPKSPSVAPSVEKSCVPQSAARPATWLRKTEASFVFQFTFSLRPLCCYSGGLQVLACAGFLMRLDGPTCCTPVALNSHEIH